MQTAIFAAGCFWGVESAFAELPGVVETEVGYCGGKLDHPTYEDVCSGATGHAEAVRVTFDPGKIIYAALVQKFFALHDPTQMNRQGPDVGDQYRSAIFATTPEQAQIAESIKGDLTRKGVFKRPIATIIQPATPFWRAEEYHQKYHAKRGGGSCHI
jgi:peptide-methionine (S)-S-oxide reductase